MSTFEATRHLRNQRHFEVFEIDLPVITGACTLGSAQGYGTPLTCDQAWSGEWKTYYFTNTNAPILPSINGEPIHRYITAIKETSSEIKPSEALAGRGSLTVTFKDFAGDPNLTALGVTDTVKNQGDFLAKLDERQVIDKKNARLKLYRVEEDGTVDLANGAQTRHFKANTFKSSGDKKWVIECKDALSIANTDEKVWPIASGGFIRLDVDDAVIAIPVDSETDYSSAFCVRVGGEFMRILSVDDNLTASATLNVPMRGSDIYSPVSTVRLTETRAESHSAGDDVFICSLSDDETIDALYARILTESGIDASLIPSAEWLAEADEWHTTSRINTLHSESKPIGDTIKQLLGGYLIDSWHDVISNEIKLSAISVWKQSTATVSEGKEVNAYSVKKTIQDSLRATRALVVYGKKDLAQGDDPANFKKSSTFSDPALISDALYPEHKDKIFDKNPLLNNVAADLLTQRYVSRFKFPPKIRTLDAEERHLNYNVGDVIDLNSTIDQGADGLPKTVRGQILKINPIYGKDGRTYKVKAMTYEAAFDSGAEIVLDSPLGSVNLFVLAGAPSQAVELTFIIKSPYSYGATAMRAGAFASGSKLIIITVDGFDGQANGGNGGTGQSISKQPGFPVVTFDEDMDGQDGGVVYDAQGVDTDFYLSGSTPSTAYPVADGYVRAPSGGDGGFNHTQSSGTYTSGKGGDAGDGRTPGSGGFSGTAFGDAVVGQAGVNGEIDGSGSGWGNDGADNDANRGLAGSGILDNGATVNLFGADASRYINGNGDH